MKKNIIFSLLTNRVINSSLLFFPSSQPVFEYFRERTPRSYIEVRETSLLWNYKYAGVWLFVCVVVKLKFPLDSHVYLISLHRIF